MILKQRADPPNRPWHPFLVRVLAHLLGHEHDPSYSHSDEQGQGQDPSVQTQAQSSVIYLAFSVLFHPLWNEDTLRVERHVRHVWCDGRIRESGYGVLA